LSVDLADQQRAFAAHLRDPERVPPPPGIEPRRLAIYRDLFFNNLADLLGGAFPVARRILGDQRWKRLVRAFFAGHHARTPYFLELPREFLEWLQSGRERAADEPPFLDELAHYEWVELALAVSQEELPAAAPSPPSPVDARLEVSPLAWPLAYRWPVHRLAPEFQPAEPPATPTFIVVYRDRADVVQFLEIGAETARLLETLERVPGTTAREALDGSEAAAEAAAQAVANLIGRGVLCVTSEARSTGS
jgi:uncharacterized protein